MKKKIFISGLILLLFFGIYLDITKEYLFYADKKPAMEFIKNIRNEANYESLTTGITFGNENIANFKQKCEQEGNVKIIFWGQSITKQIDVSEFEKHLQNIYKDTHFEIINNARGGCSASCLNGKEDWAYDDIGPCEYATLDILPESPDLIIFHVLGNHRDYKQIIKTLRRSSDADIAIWNDHIWDNDEDSWSNMMSYKFLPHIAEQYKLFFIDIRTPWIQYLTETNIDKSELLADEIHLNTKGIELLTTILNANF